MIDPIENPEEFNERVYAADRATRTMFNKILRNLLIMLLIATVLALGIGAAVAGVAGLYGALLALGLAALFVLTTVIVMRATAAQPVYIASAAALGSWFVKVLIVFGVLLLVRDSDFYHRGVFVFTLIPLIIASSVIEMKGVAGARVLYVDPSVTPAEPRPRRRRGLFRSK
ncbi:hypothetical protein [Bowdeniella massiliensis]|uniref:hypothetical protein n=1 Tax=Bowdeniella massiliensis TaxID=2932264 RepID=UPI0020288CDF|nr:hypothetical protein [Bowdeniella massiliensis]